MWRWLVRSLRQTYNWGVASKPEQKPKGQWTPEEIERNEQANKLRVAKDRKRGVDANLEDGVKLTHFANEFAAAFRDARRA